LELLNYIAKEYKLDILTKLAIYYVLPKEYW